MEKAERRPRHDGFTPERTTMSLARLAETGCVRDACRTAGISDTSAYRARTRMSDFAARWDMALTEKRPILEQAAFDRAIHGVEVALPSRGKVVTFRRYSDALLKYLLEREDRRRERERKLKPWQKPKSLEDVTESILTKFAAMDAHDRAREEEEALAYAERMRAEGWAP